jgi:hypothetical protein
LIVGAKARNERLIKGEEIQQQRISTITLLESQVGCTNILLFRLSWYS